MLKVCGTRVESACCKLLILTYDKPLSNFACNFNSRPYTKVAAEALRVCAALVPILRPGGTSQPMTPEAKKLAGVLMDAALARMAGSHGIRPPTAGISLD